MIKKLKVVLVIALCLLVTLSSCTSGNKISGSESMSVESEEESGEVFVQSPDVDIIKQYVSQKTDTKTKGTNLFKGLKYTYSVQPNDGYPDSDSVKLTDGIVRDLFDSHNWVGITEGSRAGITFDISALTGVQIIDVSVLQQIDYGIYYPTKVSLEASDDGENFTVVSSLSTPDGLEASSKYVYRFAMQNALKANYVRVSFAKPDGRFLFIDEIFGYAYDENGETELFAGEIKPASDKISDYYEYKLNTEVTVPVAVSDSDYYTYQNLAAIDGVDMQITHFDPMAKDTCDGNSTLKQCKEKLLDGKKASEAEFGDAANVKFTRGWGRSVVIDLGNVMSADKAVIYLLNQTGAGVGAPPAFSAEVSTDGDKWVTAGGIFTHLYGEEKTENVTVEIPFADSYSCRYVRISFQTEADNETAVHVFMSEIEVWGTKAVSEKASLAYDGTVGVYPDGEKLGVKAVSFTAIDTVESGSYLDFDRALKLLAYYKDGELADYFFDTITLASFNRPIDTGDIVKETENWADLAFMEDYNLDALNAAIAEVNKVLGENRKVGIYLNLCCPRSADKCGDVDGDGKAEDMSTAEGRNAFIKWQIDMLIKRYTDKAYENLTLLGFYWHDETVHEDAKELDIKVMTETNRYIHSLGYGSFWCPYYDAYGIWLWQDMGFDFACLQPNYMFYATEQNRLYTAAKVAKLNGMCVELEIEDIYGEGSCGLYREYLRAGYDTGYMNGIQMYYHGGAPGVIPKAMDGDSEHTRAVYHDTYLYMMRKLDETYNIAQSGADLSAFTDISLDAKQGRFASVKLGNTDEINVMIKCSPLFGTLCINTDGRLTYNAMEGYKGEDKIILVFKNAIGETKEITVTVNIK